MSSLFTVYLLQIDLLAFVSSVFNSVQFSSVEFDSIRCDPTAAFDEFASSSIRSRRLYFALCFVVGRLHRLNQWILSVVDDSFS